jgi:putative transposase
MRQMRTQDGYTVKELCATFDVSRSGFYAQGQKAQRGRRQQDARLAEQIGVLFMQSRQTYGCRRLQHQLRREGIRCGKSRIRRLMNQGQLQAIQKRRFRVKTTQSHHELPVAPNRLGQLAQPPSRPNQVWTADITYLPTQQEGWLYLAAEMDLCSKRIAGTETGRFTGHAAGGGCLQMRRARLVNGPRASPFGPGCSVCSFQLPASASNP